MAILSIPVDAAFDNTTAAIGSVSASTTETVTVSFSQPGVKTVYSLKLTGTFDATSNIQNLTGAMYTTPDGAIFNISLTFFQPTTGFDLAASSVRVDRLWGVVLLDDDWFNLGAQADSVSLHAGDDYVDSGGGNDTITGGAGNDTLNGNTGNDTSVYTGTRASFTLATSGNNLIVTDLTGAEGVDTLVNIERLRFADVSVNLQVKGIAAAAPLADVQRISELYVAFFNRIPDADGLSYWIGQKSAGQSISQIADTFYNAGVQYSSLTGFTATMSNADFVNIIYKNVLGRKDGADAGGLAYWTGKLADGSATRGALVSTILDSAHSYKGDATYGYVADLLDNKNLVAKTFAIDLGLNYNTSDASITNGMAIAAAVTPTSTAAAISLIGVNIADVQLS